MALHLPIAPSQATPRRFRGQKYLGFRCTQCGNCCTQTIVPITADDLSRLIRGTHLRPLQVVTFNKADDFGSGSEDLAYAELDVGPRVMCLRRRRDGQDDPCAFYRDGACSVYEHRPVTCRLWPFDVTLDEEGRMSRLGLDCAVKCPYELDGRVDEQALVSDYRAWNRQDRRWHRQVAAWNRQHAGGTRRHFLGFIGFP